MMKSLFRPSLEDAIASNFPHSITPLVSFNAILSQPRAIVNASRLHYTLSMLRLITSDNDTASIMATIPVSTSQASLAIGSAHRSSYTMRNASDTGNAAILYDIAQRTAWAGHGAKESLFL